MLAPNQAVERTGDTAGVFHMRGHSGVARRSPRALDRFHVVIANGIKMSDRHCIFCDIIERVESAFIVYENSHTIVSGTSIQSTSATSWLSLNITSNHSMN